MISYQRVMLKKQEYIYKELIGFIEIITLASWNTYQLKI